MNVREEETQEARGQRQPVASRRACLASRRRPNTAKRTAQHVDRPQRLLHVQGGIDLGRAKGASLDPGRKCDRSRIGRYRKRDSFTVGPCVEETQPIAGQLRI